MLYADTSPKKYAASLQRVLIVEPQPQAARMLHELLKDLGAQFVRVESTLKGGLAAAREDDPQIIFTELRGPALDGLAFVRQLRRSDFDCRKAPVIVVTGEATAASIMGSRDAGVHEFLRKPFTLKDLTRRVEAVSNKPRNWVEAVEYVGPDRRRFNSADYQGPRKRKSDDGVGAGDGGGIDQAVRILKSALAAIEKDPRQALRAMQAQAEALAMAASRKADPRLTAASSRLHTLLQAQAAAGRLSRPELEAACQPFWPYMEERAA